MGIVSFDQIDLPLAPVFLQRFLAVDGDDDGPVLFEPDAARKAMLLGEPGIVLSRRWAIGSIRFAVTPISSAPWRRLVIM